MEDLLKEEDFLSKKLNYNPWKYFRVFFGIAFFHSIVAFMLIASYNDNTALVLLLLVSPCIMAFIMTFANKRIAELSLKAILLAVLSLLAVYYVVILLAFLIAGSSSQEMGIVTLGLVGYFIFCTIIIVPIVKVKQKHRKYII